jgi:hypothetical protein
MKVELQIQGEVKNLLEAVQTTVLSNVIAQVRSKKLDIPDTQFVALKRVIDASVQQAYANGATGLSQICKTLETRLNEENTRP